jgi:hypothetical protein
MEYIEQIKCEACDMIFDEGRTCECDHRRRRWKPWGRREISPPGNKRVQLIVPASLLDAFDLMIDSTPEMLNRTSELLRLMAAAIKKHERQKQNDTRGK